MILHPLSTTDNIKKQLEPEFRTWMSNIGISASDPAWFNNGEFVVTKKDKRENFIKLGAGGAGSVFLAQFLDVGVA